ncbi:MAG: AI-2E family transporter [Nitrospirae bacterium]|nr:AI-2E family transporter [Nitrospirota bacterium]
MQALISGRMFMALRFYTIVLVVISVVLGYLSFKIIQPFISSIAWAAALSIVFYPLYLFFQKHIKIPAAASVATMLVVVVLLIGPFSYLSYLLAIELGHILKQLQAGRADEFFRTLFGGGLPGFFDSLLGYFNTDSSEIFESLSSNLKEIIRNSAGFVSKGVGNVFNIGLEFVLMFFTLFFFFKDGASIIHYLSEFMPFTTDQKKILTAQVKDIVISTLYGGVVVALTQGLLGGFAYWILGVPSPVLWGMLTAIVAFLPIVGAFVVWGPIAVYLFFSAGLLYSMIMCIIGIFVISLADNLLRPILIGSRTKMPVLVIFFSVLGGIKFFGIIGFIAGPLVVALFVSVLQIFRNIQHEAV